MDRLRKIFLKTILLPFAALWVQTTLAADLTGNVPGELNVHNGSLNYAVPIDAVGGRGGMQPQLAFSYTGQGNTALGFGWALTGYSTIHRCSATIAQDGFTAGMGFNENDRFCLDGQPLVAVNGTYGHVGTEYKTAIDNYSRIVSVGGENFKPNYFTAKTKAGHYVVFGSGGGSEVNVDLGTISWSTYRITDTTQNTITFSYTTENNAIRLTEVKYPGGKVVVSYGYTKSYQPTTYSLGRAINPTKIVSSVKTYNEHSNSKYTLVKQYFPSYKNLTSTKVLPSITQIKICGTSSSDCLKPVVFTTPSQTYGGPTSVKYDKLVNELGRTKGRSIVDVNGDGRADICRIIGGTNHVNTRLNCHLGAANGITGGAVSSAVLDWGYEEHRWWIDFNGDGLSDFCRRVGGSNLGSTQIRCHFSTGSGFEHGFVTGNLSFQSSEIQWADINGDGLQDLCSINSSGNRRVQCYKSTGSSLSPTAITGSWLGTTPREHWLVDINGDGITDFCGIGQNMYCRLSTSTGNDGLVLIQALTGGSWAEDTGTWEDVNGDGLPDFCRLYDSGTYQGQTRCTLNKGGLTSHSSLFANTWVENFSHGFENEARWWIDANADGKTDFCRIEKVPTYGNRGGVTYKYYLSCNYSNGVDGFDTYKKLSSEQVSRGEKESRSWADINGDGNLDFCVGIEGSSQDRLRCYKHTANSVNQITKITESNGLATDIEYDLLTNPYVYSKSGGVYDFPKVHAIGPMRVVRWVRAETGAEKELSTRYTYKRLVTHAQGRGSFGYAEVREDYYAGGQSYKAQIAEFDQTNFPIAGNLKKLTEKIGTRVINESLTTYGTVANGNTVGIYVARQEDKSYEANNGSLISTVVTENKNVDIYGQVGQVVVTTSGGGKTFQQTTNSTYQPVVEAYWHLGRVTKAVTEHDSSDAPSKKRQSSFRYHASNGLMYFERVESEQDDEDRLYSTHTTYNDYGQKTRVSTSQYLTSSSDDGSRVSTSEYNSQGQVKKVCDALGLCTSNTYYSEGWLKDVTDANNLKVSYEYDSLGRKKKETRPDGSYTSYAYHFATDQACGTQHPDAYSCVVVDSNTSKPAITQYDKRGNEVRTISNGLHDREIFKDTEYDERGRVTRTTRPYFSGQTLYWATSEYDNVDRVISATEPANHGGVNEISTTYNGLTTTTTTNVMEGDFPSRTKITKTNVMGKVVELTEPDGANGTIKTNYTYDVFGNLKTTVVNGDDKTKIELFYNEWGHKNRMKDPDMGEWHYSYNGFGELKTQRDPNGNVITMKYDALGRLKERVEPEGTSTWEYYTKDADAGDRGQLKKETGLGLTKTYNYDSLGRPQSVTHKIGSQSFTTTTNYDALGRPLQTTYPGGNGFYTKNVYDDITGHLIAVRGSKSAAENHSLSRLQPLIAEASSLASDYLNKSNQLRNIANSYQAWLDGGTASALTAALNSHKSTLQTIKNQGIATEVKIDQVIPIMMNGIMIPIVGQKSLKLDPEFFYHWQNTVEELETVIDILNAGANQYSQYANQLSVLATQTLAAADHTFDVNFMLNQADEAYTELVNNGSEINYWQALDADASGRLSAEMYGNGIINDYNYDQATGFLQSVHSGVLSAYPVKHLEYEYDGFNNVTTRTDLVNDVQETFSYDSLDRLKTTTVASSLYNNSDMNKTVNISYNRLGNIHSKSDVGTYTYHPTKIHAVTKAGSNNYSYDPNGNMTTRNGITQTFHSYNKPKRLEGPKGWAEFSYGPNHSRYKKVNNKGHTTLYVGGLYEKTTRGSVTEQKHYIVAGGKVVAEHIISSKDGIQSRYLHSDALGSVDTVTDAYGEVVDRRSFDAWGKLRNMPWKSLAGLNDPLYLTQLPYTNKGYTGHEQIAEVDLVHMNGRVYDPAIGRFLSADPHIQFAHASQSYNRYSYVMNNPMKYTDPSGYFLAGLFKSVRKAWKSAWKAIKPYAGIIVAAVISFYCPVCTAMGGSGPWAIALNGALAGAASGAVGAAVSGGDIFKAAVIGGLSGAAFAGIGGLDQAGPLLKARAIGLHGLVGGLQSVAQGGKFGQGFLSAGFGKFVSTNMPFDKMGLGNKQGFDGWGRIAGRTTIAAISGGVGSVIGGGKFESGAKTAALAHLLNAESGELKERVLGGQVRRAHRARAYDPAAAAAQMEGVTDAGLVVAAWGACYLTGGLACGLALMAHDSVWAKYGTGPTEGLLVQGMGVSSETYENLSTARDVTVAVVGGASAVKTLATQLPKAVTATSSMGQGSVSASMAKQVYSAAADVTGANWTRKQNVD